MSKRSYETPSSTCLLFPPSSAGSLDAFNAQLRRERLAELRSYRRKWGAVAVRIQRVWRGYLGKLRWSRLRIERTQRDAATAIQTAFRAHRAHSRILLLWSWHHKKVAATAIQHNYRVYRSRMLRIQLRTELKNGFSAIQIQRRYRGQLGRQVRRDEERENIVVTMWMCVCCSVCCSGVFCSA